MSDPVAELRAELVAAARRQAAASCSPGRRRKARGWQGRHLAALAAVLLFSGSAAAAAVKLTEERSAPLSGTLPHLHPSGGEDPSPSGARYRITMLPDLQAGHTGWCETLTIGHNGGGGGCRSAPSATEHMITGASNVISGNQLLEYAIVDSQVAAIRLNGKRIRTIKSPGLPGGWRAAVTIVGFRDQRGAAPLMEWTALNSSGRPFPKPRHAEGSVDAPTRAVSTTHPPAGRCSIHQVQPISGLKTIAARAIRGRPRHQPPLDGPAFTSCAETTFTLHGSGLAASVLIDASDPKQPAPALPGASARPDAPRVVEISTGMRQAPPMRFLVGAGIPIETGSIIARRDGTAWLAVQGGTAQQRRAVLSALTTDASLR